MKVAAALALVFCTGCATVINGRFQTVEIASSPAGAQVRMECDGRSQDAGVTPARAQIRRGAEGCQWIVSRQGYAPVAVPLTRTRSRAVWANAVPGFALGIVAGAAFAIGHLLGGEGDDYTGVVTVGGIAVGTGTGVLIDRSTGAAYKHVPDRVDVMLAPPVAAFR